MPTKQKQTKKPAKAAKHEQTLVAMLLDRTGSMQSVKQETISGFNAYLDELQKKPEASQIRLHVSQFDTRGIDVLCSGVELKAAPRLNNENYQPRDFTNLYDAIGRTIRAIEEQAKGGKVFFVVQTDGLENASREWNIQTVQDAIKAKEKDGWTFTYIGIGPEAWAANATLSAGTQGASNVLRAGRGKNTKAAYGHAAKATMMRCATPRGQMVANCYVTMSDISASDKE